MSKLMIALALLLQVAPPQEKTFTLSGTLKFDGEVPKPKVNKALLNDPACKACHVEDPLKDDLVVDSSGGIRWAIVYVKKGLEEKTFDPPAGEVLIDQVGCTYAPHVAGAMVGQTVNFRNSDPMLHNVMALPFLNKAFNFGQIKGAVNGLKFSQQEIPVKLVCNVHPFMVAYVGVFDHPFYAVTDATGKFEIKNLPPGKYTVGVWHEKLKTDDQNIVVEGDTKLEFKLK
jgi:plastocyanin